MHNTTDMIRYDTIRYGAIRHGVTRFGRKQASAEDEQRLTELVEKEIVGRNLLGAFGPLLVSARPAKHE